MLRQHQKKFEAILDGIIEGSGVKIIDIVATPGAGKSSIPIQAARLIDAGLADRLLWVVPRSALQNQGERGFIDPFFRDLFKHRSMIRASTNDQDPCRGTQGFITTYQAIASDRFKTVLSEVKTKRYIIVLDEPHHLEKNGVWHKSIDEIVMAGHFLIKMTGTLGRGDKKEIAYINYKNKLPYFKNRDEERLILYSRVQALKEKAILPIEFFLSDGQFQWKKQNGKLVSLASFASAYTHQQQSESLFTALNSEFANELLEECVAHWQGIRKTNRRAKLLIITADFKQAQTILAVLKKYQWMKTDIATSHESTSAEGAIKSFKSGKIDCLVTIAMAYEGLDVPEITHECVLTNIRSREWVEQMLARGVRIDKAAGNYNSQKCYVFAPLDPRFKKIVDMIKKQQVTAIEYYAQIKEEIEVEEQEEKEVVPHQQITPISSSMTSRERFMMGLDVIQATEIEIKTVKEQEIEIRTEIHAHINRFCFKNRYKQQRINSEIKSRFGKRDLLTLPGLEKLKTFILQTYPVDDSKKTIKEILGVSSPQRGKSKRVTTKVTPWTKEVSRELKILKGVRR